MTYVCEPQQWFQDDCGDVFSGAAWTLVPVDLRTGRAVPVGRAVGTDCAMGIPARIPGTITGALRDALGGSAVDEALAVAAEETAWEYRTRITTAGGLHKIRSRGVATVSELWVAGHRVKTSTSAFAPWDDVVRLPPGECDVALRLLPLSTVTVPRKPRAKWLSPLVSDRSLRWRRTPLIGHIDWPGARPVLGPWGGLSAEPVPAADRAPVIDARPRAVRTRVDESGVGTVLVDLRVNPTGRTAESVRLSCAGAGVEVVVTDARTRGRDAVTVELPVPNPRLWWPHAMAAGQAAEPALHEVRVEVGDTTSSHRVGFRSVTAQPRADRAGLGLRVNGVPVFARGVVWAGADPFETAADPASVRMLLMRLRTAGATMIRLPGTGCYESDTFHDLCDELGLMVWQDVALGPLDPPDDPGWRAQVSEEVRSLAARSAAHPSTVVISGGTEVIQAPVLAGRPAAEWTPDVLVEDIPRAVGAAGADVVVVASSPCSDADLDAAARAYEAGAAASAERPVTIAEPVTTAVVHSPVDATDGVCHYFGVGAYGRALEDARSSGVRFAAECLAFAVPPEPATVREQFGTDGPLDHPDRAAAWQAGLARDPGAAWTFEDTTMRYVQRLFLDRDSDPNATLAAPARAADETALATHAGRLDYQRAALAHVFQRALAHWRRSDSPCRGALILASHSTAPGAGWGVLDAAGRPTAAWYGMRRACAPTTVCFLPEGGNGLSVHLWHDGPGELSATLRWTVATVQGGCQQPIEVAVTVPARGGRVLRGDLADGTFRDLDNAYGFGAREYEGIRAELVASDGTVLATDVHLSGGPRRDDLADPEMTARWVRDRSGTRSVEVTSQGLARFVALDLPTGLVAEDGYVHLLPGDTVRLPVSGTGPFPTHDGGYVRALGVEPVPIT
ncbi:glycoside hydrolase family 2 protein [Kocuria sp.]|uniref:glycoside hydrolase family 2 protein n=1 Tax=Kocuria sp. TaxID=1871328 RepID=UPI0026DFCEB9|nr:glycoside hydrolase family 2 protein [Kocuria sp.]MDO5367791.1 hypothetical protein [Kocuria sp.]